MEVLRDTDGSYVFTFLDDEKQSQPPLKAIGADSQESIKADPLEWDRIRDFFLSYVKRYEIQRVQDAGIVGGTEGSIEEDFCLVENICHENGWIGYWAMRNVEIMVPAQELEPIPLPGNTVELPATQVPGIPMSAEDWERFAPEMSVIAS